MTTIKHFFATLLITGGLLHASSVQRANDDLEEITVLPLTASLQHAPVAQQMTSSKVVAIQTDRQSDAQLLEEMLRNLECRQSCGV